jgi:hypothetical protein
MPQPKHRHDAAHVGLVPTAQLGTGTPSAATALLGDQTWGNPAAGAVEVSDGGAIDVTGVTEIDFTYTAPPTPLHAATSLISAYNLFR